MLKSIQQMLDAFEENNIKYCHWKSNEHLEEALMGDTDLDVLFLPEQRTQIDSILNNCGLKRFRSTSLMQYNAIEDYIGFDKECAKIWHLHTHYRMTLGEKHLKGYTITPWTDKVINNRVLSDNGIYTSCPEDELILLLIRNAMKLRWRDFGSKIGKDDIKEFDWLLERIEKVKLKAHISQYVDEMVAEEILKLIEIRPINKNQLLRLKKLLLRNLNSFTGYTKFSSWWTRSKREGYWFVGAVSRRCGLNACIPSRRVSPSGGCVVAFLGTDGAGKSTSIKYAKTEFGKKIDVKTVYLGSGDGSSSLIRKPMKLVAKKVGGKGVGHAVEKEYSKSQNKISWKSRLYSFAKIIWAVTLAAEKKKKLKEITKARNNGMLVLTDRYPQCIKPGYSDGPLLIRYKEGKGILRKIAEWEYVIYKRASLNPPDITIKLVAPLEVAQQRKPEMTLKELELKKNVVMNMNVSDKFVVIDTSAPFEITMSEVMDEIWKLI